MKIVSIIVLAFVLFINNTAMAETAAKRPDFEQMKAKALQAASNHIDVLTKFKSCVQAAKSGPELGVCRKQKNETIKALRMKNRKAQAKNIKTKKMEVKPAKSAE